MARQNYTHGYKFGDLTVIEKAGTFKGSDGRSVYSCECACGRKINKIISAVRSRAKKLKTNATACCNECCQDQNSLSRDIHQSEIYTGEPDSNLSTIDKWLRMPILGGCNA